MNGLRKNHIGIKNNNHLEPKYYTHLVLSIELHYIEYKTLRFFYRYTR